MACLGRYANAGDYNNIWRAGLDLSIAEVRDEVERALDFYAAKLHAARAAVDACECSVSAWGTDFLKSLNVIGAAVVFRPSCGPKLTDEVFDTYLDFLGGEIDKILDGTYELCEGYTGSLFPAIGYAEINYNEFSAAQIIENAIARESG